MKQAACVGAENENCQEDVLEIESQACVSDLSDALSTDVRSAAGRLFVSLSGDSNASPTVALL